MPSEIKTVVDEVIEETADELLNSPDWRRHLETTHPGIDPESNEAKALAKADAIELLGLY